jgi:predicted O-methyltransferase YrrM
MNIFTTAPCDEERLRANLMACGEFDCAQPGVLQEPEPGLLAGRWTLPDGRIVALHGRRAHDDAVAQLTRMFGTDVPNRLVVIGLGLGYVLDALETMRADTRVLALEPEIPILAAMLRRRDWRRWIESGRLMILVGSAYRGAREASPSFDASDLPPVVVHPVLAREASAKVMAARMTFEEMRFESDLDFRRTENRQSMLHHSVLVMMEHIACTTSAAILEIGAYVGGGTMAFCRGLRESGRSVPFWSVEPGGAYPSHPHLPSSDILSDLRRNLQARSLDRFVTLVNASTNDADAISMLQQSIAPTGLSVLSIDADGQVQRDFDHFLHLCKPGCAVFVDDYSSEHAVEKVGTTREAVDRMVAAGVLESHGVHGFGTWIGHVVRPPQL